MSNVRIRHRSHRNKMRPNAISPVRRPRPIWKTKRVANKTTASPATVARHRKPQRADRAGEQPGGGGKQTAAPCTAGNRPLQAGHKYHPSWSRHQWDMEEGLK